MAFTGGVAMMTACGGVAPQPETPASPDLPPAGPGDQYEADLPEPGRADARYLGLRIDPKLQCNLEEAPKFPFDETEMLPQHRRHIVDLAACLQSEDLATAAVDVVGHADPRGSEDYNERLGKRRAEFVKSLLVKQGLDEDRIFVHSEGEEHAKGDTEDYSYGYDRHVEVHVDDADYGMGPGREAHVEPIGEAP